MKSFSITQSFEQVFLVEVNITTIDSYRLKVVVPRESKVKIDEPSFNGFWRRVPRELHVSPCHLLCKDIVDSSFSLHLKRRESVERT